ncbi:MAG: hypothetical protein M1825_001672 [Sarcosagium campestre]|nr:MAG: hypothetical protein M1825_001672 [Sarcosagium campestre]
MAAPVSPAGRPTKTMSSKLLTMKFMQRAAASSSSAPADLKYPLSKRQRLSEGKNPPSPGIDRIAVKAALDLEEQKRSEALERQAADAGETKWVLSFRDGSQAAPDRTGIKSPTAFHVVKLGYAGVDDSSESIYSHQDQLDRREATNGRKSFGKFNKTLEKDQTTDDTSSDDGSSSSALDSDADGAESLQGLQAADNDQSQRSAQRRLTKGGRKGREDVKNTTLPGREVPNLSHGISSGGGGQRACYNCGRTDHLASSCQQQARRGGGRDDDGRNRRQSSAGKKRPR